MRRTIPFALFFVVVTLVFTIACAPSSTATNTAASGETTAAASETASSSVATAAEATPALLQLTLEELKQYDGQNGNPAYIAVDGVIYDVTNVPQWSGGKHNGYTAGQDLTDAIKNVSPHGVSKLKDVPVVGELVG